MAGVTVRALHHYDRLGLLRPRRSGSGYRVYQHRDLERLEQIIALKFLGIPLKRIKTMLDRNGLELPDALRMQRTVLEEKRRLLDRAILAIEKAEGAMVAGRPADAALLTKIIEVIEMQNDNSWTDKYYSPEAKAKIAERAKTWDPAQQAEVMKQWTELFTEVEAAMTAGEDPAGERAQALGVRWRSLAAGFTGGDPEIASGLRKVWNDQANWPAEQRERAKPFAKPAVWEYIGRVMKCG